MTKKKDQRHRLYMDFASLHNKSDKQLLAFIKKHNLLGLNPWENDLYNESDETQWEFIRKHGPLGLDPRASVPSWNYSANLLEGRQWFFIPWETGWPVPEKKAQIEEETPDLFRREARKMYLVIKLWQIVGECTEKGFLTEKFFHRKKEIDPLVDELSELMTGTSGTGHVYFSSSPGLPIKDQIKFPNLEHFFKNVLKRVRLSIVRDDIRDDIRKSPFLFSNFQIEEACLLARLWYEMISDMIGKKAPPRVCPYCNQLFSPDRPNQVYCNSYCQEAASHRNYRKRVAEKEGRKLRPTPGRPPGAGTDKGKNTPKKEAQS